MQPEDECSWIWNAKEIRRPDNSLDRKYYWNKIFIVSCLCAISTDPLFLYVPILKDDIKCLMLDPKLKIVVLLLRSLTDLFFLMDTIIRVYRSENCSGLIVELKRRQHQMNFSFVLKSCVPTIAKTICASNDILIDIVALLPLPHVAILIFFSKMSDLRSLTTTRMVLMNIFALLQYVPRVLRIYLLSKELNNRPLEKEITETPMWIKGVLNFYMYIIASHVIGALWYFFAIQRMMICWHSACRKDDGCDNRIFGCHDHYFFRNTTILNDLCPVSVNDNSSDIIFFDFGIFATVLKYGVVGSTNYFRKFLNCYWWGLQNLSSLGSNLEPSVDAWENLYTIFISTTGLLLFLYLIGNLQMYMQLANTRRARRREDYKRKMLMKQKIKEKGQEVELWLFKHGIPTRLIKDMKLPIMKEVQALEASLEIKLDDILPLLPSDVRSGIKDSMPLRKLKQELMLRGVDEGLLKIIYKKLEPVKYTKDNFIVEKGKSLEKMVCIVDGFVSIEERSSDDPRRGAGELFGQELLRCPFSTYLLWQENLATESVKAIGVVEALALNKRDLASLYIRSDILQKPKIQIGQDKAVTVKELINATGNFSDDKKLNSSGTVYKADLKDYIVAVKKLDPAQFNEKIEGLTREIGTIMSLQHDNILKLLDAYIDKDLQLLVYEYMKKQQSLADILFGSSTSSKSKPDWNTRVKICLGIAEGLNYLHEYPRGQILHTNIKSDNILLNENFEAKISDFGFASLYTKEDKVKVITREVPKGYMAPEYYLEPNDLTSKADVYSFGVVILEIVSGKRNIFSKASEETQVLLDRAYQALAEGNLVSLVDKSLSTYDERQAHVIMKLAVYCTSLGPSVRPTMSEVVSVLARTKNP